jgi:hypothetical protein
MICSGTRNEVKFELICEGVPGSSYRYQRWHATIEAAMEEVRRLGPRCYKITDGDGRVVWSTKIDKLSREMEK